MPMITWIRTSRLSIKTNLSETPSRTATERDGNNVEEFENAHQLPLVLVLLRVPCMLGPSMFSMFDRKVRRCDSCTGPSTDVVATSTGGHMHLEGWSLSHLGADFGKKNVWCRMSVPPLSGAPLRPQPHGVMPPARADPAFAPCLAVAAVCHTPELVRSKKIIPLLTSSRILINANWWGSNRPSS